MDQAWVLFGQKYAARDVEVRNVNFSLASYCAVYKRNEVMQFDHKKGPNLMLDAAAACVRVCLRERRRVLLGFYSK